MRKLCLFLALLLAIPCVVSATSSSVDPTYPAPDDLITSEGLRQQFQAAHDDLNTLFAQINLPTISANQILGAISPGTAGPISMPSCSGASQALTWTTGV